MATVPAPDGVEFVEEDDGRVTARHLESGVASFGDTEAEALRQLADALESHRGEGDPIDEARLVTDGDGLGLHAAVNVDERGQTVLDALFDQLRVGL